MSDFPLPPMRSTGVVYYKGHEYIHTQILEEEGYYSHQVGDIVRVYDADAEVEVFYELTNRVREVGTGKMLPAYLVTYIQPEEIFADLPTVNRGHKKKKT